VKYLSGLPCGAKKIEIIIDSKNCARCCRIALIICNDDETLRKHACGSGYLYGVINKDCLSW
jgi:hypothetical protein